MRLDAREPLRGAGAAGLRGPPRVVKLTSMETEKPPSARSTPTSPLRAMRATIREALHASVPAVDPGTLRSPAFVFARALARDAGTKETGGAIPPPEDAISPREDACG